MFTIMLSLMLAFSTYTPPTEAFQSQSFIKPPKPIIKPPKPGGFPFKDTFTGRKPTPRGL